VACLEFPGIPWVLAAQVIVYKRQPQKPIESLSTQKGDKTMIELLRKFIRDEEGQDLVEYALLLVFLALAAIAVLPTLGSSVNRVFSQSNSALNAS
jgi:Flp pilus assembly pilin Flp